MRSVINRRFGLTFLVGCLACAAALSPTLGVAAPEDGSNPSRTIDISPNDGNNLPSPATLSVSGAGFPNSVGITLYECTADRVSCSNELGTTTSSAAGTFPPRSVNVTRTFTVPGGTTVDCVATNCVVLAEQTTNSSIWAAHHISFIPPPPGRPTLTATAPASPANDNSPEVLGNAAAGSTVSLFTNSACSGTPVATGSAATFTSPGITVSVPDNSTTTFYAIESNAGGTSACSTNSITYVEDSSAPPDPGTDTDPPETTITKEPPNKSDRERVKYKFSSDETGSTFACKMDKKPYKPCTSPRRIKVDEGRHKFSVLATDPAGNLDTSPDTDKFKIVG